MSKKKTMIVVEPDGRIHKEAFATAPMVCPYCNGRGYFTSTRDDDEAPVCPDCQGTGEVFAIVTIDWKPNIK